MECLSDGFVAAVRGLLDSDAPLLASVAQRGGGLIAEVKARPDIEMITVTRENRVRLADEITARYR